VNRTVVVELDAVEEAEAQARFLDRFPFAVVFFIEGETVHVVAVEALRKRPGYWRSRLR
jgi:hypothetical protein